MKKFLVILTIIIVSVIFSACEKDNVETITSDFYSETTESTTESAYVSTTELSDEWTPKSLVIMDDNYQFHYYSISAKVRGLLNEEGSSHLVVNDNKLVAVSNQRPNSQINPEKLEDILTACEEEFCRDINNYLGSSSTSDYDITVNSTEICTINGNDMCKYTGILSYIENPVAAPVNRSLQFVAYATRLPTSNAYVYWLVADKSDDQSLFDSIAEDAYKMALSLVEEE